MAKANKGSASAKATRSDDTIFKLPIAELRQNVAEALEHLAAAHDLLPGLLVLPSEARKPSDGKFRDGETAGYHELLDLTVSAPKYFEDLADKDEGLEPTRFEPELIRDRLERRDLLRQIVPAADDLSQRLSDSAPDLGELTKPVLLAAYGVAKTAAKHNPSVGAAISKLVDFYSAVARRAAETRTAHRAAVVVENAGE